MAEAGLPIWPLFYSEIRSLYQKFQKRVFTFSNPEMLVIKQSKNFYSEFLNQKGDQRGNPCFYIS